MAQQTVVVMTCDICGSDGGATHELTIDGKWVEFETCDGCWIKMRGVLDPAFEAGRTRRRRQRRAVTKAA